MTKEEARLVLDSLSTWVGQERLITKEVVEAIRTLSKPELPSNLDEAAEKYANRGISSYADPYEEIKAYQADKDAFKAGAEWMAGQGETKRGVATQDHFIQFADDTYIDLDPTMKLIPAFKIKDAEEIFVQIRKKQ